ncbi:ExbD/TolR family protein [Yoonia sp. SS1-5]|uniref:ExbD/TolR family protein n=1 Tax=Yoonia rhodophyticola TaxID=3137370 RepID=A0AAN0MBE3_9RHOB
MIRSLPQRKKAIGLDVSLAIVNIVLLLIFFFLATGQLLNPPSQGVDISETTELPLDQLPSPILVVRDSGSWQLDGQDVAPDLLGAALSNLETPLILHVLIGRDAPATSLLEIINRPDLSQAEIKLVTLRRTVQP